MTPPPVFVDSSALLLAFGGPSHSKSACRRLLDASRDGLIAIHVSTEAIQEFLHHRLRRTPREFALAEARVIRHLCVLHPFDGDIVDRMIDLVESSTIRGRDAVHAATAIGAGFDAIVSADKDFDGAPGLRRIDPVDWVASQT